MPRKPATSKPRAESLPVPDAPTKGEFIRQARAVWKQAHPKTTQKRSVGRPSEKDLIYAAIDTVTFRRIHAGRSRGSKRRGRQKFTRLALLDLQSKRKTQASQAGKITIRKLTRAVQAELATKSYCPHRDTIEKYVKTWCYALNAADTSPRQWNFLAKHDPHQAREKQKELRFFATFLDFSAPEWLLNADVPLTKPSRLTSK